MRLPPAATFAMVADLRGAREGSVFGEWRRDWSIKVAGVEASLAFAVIDDVESYPQFLPAVREARIVGDDNGARLVENNFLIGPVELKFRSRATRREPWGLSVTSQDGPWRRFTLDWRIEPVADGIVAYGSSRMDFRSFALAAMSRIAWPEIERLTSIAFAERMKAAARGR